MAGIATTPQEVAARWRHLPHMFQVNLQNFKTKAGKVAVSVFKKSFDLKRMNTSGSLPWPARKDRKKHPLLKETGTLKNSIKWKSIDSGTRIFTDPDSFGTAKRHAGFCYAAIHNAKSGTYSYGNRGPSVQRQFIGDSSVLDDELKKIVVTIFNGFPK